VVRRGKPELYSYATRLDGFTLLVDGRPMAELPGGAAIDPGKHRIQIAKGKAPAIIDDSVSLEPGERIDLEALAVRMEGAWEVGPRVAVMSFLDGGNRRDVMGSTLGVGATLVYRNWPSHRVNLRFDAIGTTGSGSFSGQSPVGPVNTSYGYTAFSVGVALPWRFALPWSDRLHLLAGPRLSMLYIQRTYQLDLVPSQSYFTFTPGLVGGLSWQTGRLTIGMEAQIDFLLLKVDGRNRSTGFGELLLGAGWRF